MTRPAPTREDLARAYYLTFNATADGQLVLADLVKRFTRPAVMKGGIDAITQTYRNAGNREVLDHILARADKNGLPVAAPDAPAGPDLSNFDLPQPP